MKFICPNCGAVSEASLPRCPYCDTLIPEGAERAYMETLHEIREELEELGSVPKAGVKTELRRQGRRLRRTAAVCAAVVLIFALLFFWQEKRWERDNTADYIWQHENYPYMTELYEQGEWEALKEFIFTAMEEDRPLWDWEHYEEFWDRLEEEA